jgi:8-oxo-dGTP diphosphatase
MWSTPGGEVKRRESVIFTALRELREETGLNGRLPRVIAQAASRLDDGHHWQSVFVAVDVAADAEPVLVEPEKCDRWEWFDPDSLPEPLFAPVAAILA